MLLYRANDRLLPPMATAAPASRIPAAWICAQVTAKFWNLPMPWARLTDTPARISLSRAATGDKWCLCALRWKEAYCGQAWPPVYLACTHVRALDFVTLAQLQEHALRASTP